jgi:hypothetical protein
MDIERMKSELKQYHGHLDWYLTNRQVRRMHAEMMAERMTESKDQHA